MHPTCFHQFPLQVCLFCFAECLNLHFLKTLYSFLLEMFARKNTLLQRCVRAVKVQM